MRTTLLHWIRKLLYGSDRKFDFILFVLLLCNREIISERTTYNVSHIKSAFCRALWLLEVELQCRCKLYICEGRLRARFQRKKKRKRDTRLHASLSTLAAVWFMRIFVVSHVSFLVNLWLFRFDFYVAKYSSRKATKTNKEKQWFYPSLSCWWPPSF